MRCSKRRFGNVIEKTRGHDMRRFCTFLLHGAALGGVLATAACQTPGEDAKANVYGENQVDTRQAAEVINILTVLPAKVEVDNSQNQKTAQVVGGVLGALGGGLLGGSLANNGVAGGTVGAVGGGVAGAAAGSLVPAQVLVAGVSITYEDQGHVYNSAQVGQVCEFAPGKAIVVATTPGETRIQPNATCPPPKA
jgi:outer membrane lipoprotein SlyB